MKTLLLSVIGFYQRAISPLTPASCRFHPTCSEYARQAVDRYGALRGGGLAFRRLLRCHPFGSYGSDPVPTLPSGPSRSAEDPRDATVLQMMSSNDGAQPGGTT